MANIGWWSVDNAVNEIMINDSLKHTLKKAKKIQKRTIALNVELKKFSGLKEYSQYVTIKTDILRDISDNDDTDDEPLSHSAIASRKSFIVSRRDTHDNEEVDNSLDNRQNGYNATEDFLGCDYGEEAEQDGDNVTEDYPEHDYEEEAKEKQPVYDHNGLDVTEKFSEAEEQDGRNVTEEFSEAEEQDGHNVTEDYPEHDYEKEAEEKRPVDEHNGLNVTKEFSETDDKEELEEEQSEIDTSLQKKSQPIITCTEIVKSKYTIIRDEDDKDNSIDESCKISDCPADEHDLDNNEAIQVERILPEDIQVEKILPEDIQVEKILPEDIQVESILPEAVDLDRILPEAIELDRQYPEAIEMEDLSPETRRVSQMKRLNLLYDNSESDSSQDEDCVLPGQKRSAQVGGILSSQVIDDSSDSDNRRTSPETTSKKNKIVMNKTKNYCSSVSLSQQISDSDNDDVDDRTKKSRIEVPEKESMKKSMKSQINEQESDDSNDENSTKRNDRSVVIPISNEVPSEAESLRYVLRNLSSPRDEDDLYSTSQTSAPVTEMLPRPIELDEFIDREGLILTRELSTININDTENWNEEDGDEEMWLMEIPRTIITDRQLCGKRIVLKREKMKIDNVSYKTINRHDKSVSCILSAGKEGTHYKTVNMRPVGSIVVRQESSEMNSAASSTKSPCQSSAVRTSLEGGGANLVPFPNNIKSRNPLMALNVRNERSNLNSSASNSCVGNEEVSVEKKVAKKKKSKEITTRICNKMSRKVLKKLDCPSQNAIPLAKVHKGGITKRKSSQAKNGKRVVWHLNNFVNRLLKKKQPIKKLV